MFHQTIVIGNLGNDPELKTLPSGTEVCNFSVAVTERWKSKDGEKQERTEWYRCSAFSGTAKFIASYFSKGKSIGVVGTMQTRQYEKDGQTHYATDLKVQNAFFVGNKSDGASGGGGGSAPASGDTPDDSIPF